MNKSETSPTFTLGVNNKHGLIRFLSHSARRYLSHADYFGFGSEDTTVVKVTVGHKDEWLYMGHIMMDNDQAWVLTIATAYRKSGPAFKVRKWALGPISV
ncbi:MAG: hypothetical protein Q9175_005309 [Cornicularia normoerica]